MPRTPLLRDLVASDWPSVRAIFEQGIASGNATFEREAPAWEAFDHGHLAAPRLVAVDGERVLAYAVLSPVSGRCVYAGVAEVSIYAAAEARGRGVGSALLAGLVRASEAAGIWTLQAGIFPENAASLALHQKAGFRVVGRRERLGRGGAPPRWRDVLLLERRSAVAGAD